MAQWSRVQDLKMSGYLLDITRTLSRIGRGYATGIDRVERHYFDHILSVGAEPLFIARMGDEKFLLNVESARKIRRNLDNPDEWGLPDLRDSVRLKLPQQVRAARSFVRKEAVRSSRNLQKVLPTGCLDGYTYLNIGHSNLSNHTFETVKSAGSTASWVFIHDLIPLDHPKFTREGVSDTFERKMKAVQQYADRIVTNSSVTKDSVQRCFGQWGSVPETTVVHLGTEQLTPSGTDQSEQPYFLVLGTIEPRKNHEVLFKAWEKLVTQLPQSQVPRLLVVGQRGWNNEEVFRFLESSPLMDKHIFEMNDVSDEKLADLLAGSRALLFPSHVEGYGMPALEAASLGVPVVCSDIPIFRELIEGYGVFLKPNDEEDWADEVESMLESSALRQNGNNNGLKMPPVPTWDAHFRHVFQRS